MNRCFLAAFPHDFVKGAAGLGRIVVLRLYKQDRKLRVSDRIHHQQAQGRCLIPALRTSGSIHRRTVPAIVSAEYGFDAAERVTHYRDRFTVGKWLPLQPVQGCHLVRKLLSIQ